MKCIQCGTILPDGTKFCTECGAAQPAAVTQPEPPAEPAPQPELPAEPAPQPEPQQPAAPVYTGQQQPVPPVYSQTQQPAQQGYAAPQQPVQPTYTPPQPAQPTYYAPQQGYVPPQQPAQQRNPYTQQPTQQGNPYVQQPAQQSYPAQQGYPAPQQPIQQKKKFNPLLLIPIILGGLAVLAVLFFLLFRFIPKPAPTDPEQTMTVSPTEAVDPTGSTMPSTEAPTDTSEPDASGMKYKPGTYVAKPYGSIVFYPQYNSTWEDAFYYNAPDGEKAYSVEVTEVKQNENAESDYYLWRGKATINGQTGWIDLSDWIPTDLNETPLSAADEAYVWDQLDGIWNYMLGDRLIRFTTEEDGSHAVLIGVWDSEYDFMGTAATPIYGEKDGLIKITVKGTTDTVSDRNSDEVEISLYIDMTDTLTINWSYDREEWFEYLFGGYTPEEAHPSF